jgi:cyclophilin family peptidyl-prolyl cis-trans isomerase
MKRSLLLLVCLSLASLSFAKKPTRIAIQTEYGKIVLELYDNTPLNRDNMIKLAKQHYYDSTLFHRVIPNFVIQGGDPDSKHAKPGQMLGDGDLGYRVPAEINDTDFHKRGALGVARDNTPDKSGSACQFYIVTGKKCTDADLDAMEKRIGRKFSPAQREVYKTQGGVPHLDGNYTVFGEVVEGMDVVDKISNVKRDAHDRPVEDVHMISVRVIKPKHFLFF